MPTVPLKKTRLNIRCDLETRRLLDHAVAYAHLSVSLLVVRQARASAQAVVQARETITLERQDFEAFL